MALKRMNRKKDDSGVSEVVGSILTLSITIILFSAIFATVQTMEAPISQSSTTISVNLEEADNNYFLNITNMGGKSLGEYETSIQILVDEVTSYSFYFNDDYVGDDLEDGSWDIGDTLNLVFDEDDERERFEEVWNGFQRPGSTLELIIYDRVDRQTVHQEMIKEEVDYTALLRRVNIDYPLPWETYTIPGETITINAEVMNKNHIDIDNLTVTVDLSPLEGYDDSVEMDPVDNRPRDVNRFSHKVELDEQQNNGSYLIEVTLEVGHDDEFRENSYVVLFVGDAPVAPDDPQMVIDRIEFDPTMPTNRDLLYTTATIANVGGGAGIADIRFIDIEPDGTHREVATVEEERFAAGEGRDITVSWNIRHSGTHNISVEVEYDGEETSDYRHIVVLPNILLVDDEGTASGNIGTDTQTMINALKASNFEYDRARVSPGPSGLEYDGGEHPMRNFDIVIWMSGSRTQNILHQNDRDELQTFLENGHRLWLIGDGIADDALNGGYEGWLEEHMHAGIDETGNAPEGDLLGQWDPVEQGEEFRIVDTEIGYHGDYLNTVGEGNPVLLDTDSDSRPVAVSYNSTEAGGSRTLLQTIRLDTIDESTSGHRSHLVNKVVLWLGNVTDRDLTDLAVTSQEFYPDRFPTYKDTIEITATVRNNGIHDVYPEVVLTKNGDIVDEHDIQEIPGGSTRTYSFEWVAEPVGTHDILVVVDPFNQIEETNTDNNDITYLGVNVTVNVLFDTLIVDNTAENDASAQQLEDIYDTIGWPYFVYEVEDDQGPSAEYMNSYNSVIWVTGSKESNTLDIEDMQEISEYLNYSGFKTLVFFGDNILSDIGGSLGSVENYFLRDVLQIEPGDIGSVMEPRELLGKFDDPVTHGSNYRLDHTEWNAYSYDIIRGTPILKSRSGDIFSHRVSSLDYNIVFNSFDLSRFDVAVPPEEVHWYEMAGQNISAQSARTEYIYMMNRWFGIDDDRVELRVSDVDIITPDQYPMLGRTFLLNVRIQNLGDTGTNAMVRFRDGESHIGTESAYVPPQGFADVDMIWKPLHAGPERPIRVIVDPLDEVPEVPNERGQRTTDDVMGFNNQAIHYTPVYYFWDDMQSGTSRWNRDAQIAYISGESAIDYMGGQYDNIHTDVAGDWDQKQGVEIVDDHAMSDPYSYFMEEPEGPIGVKADVFVIMTIDNSRSMANREYIDEDGNTMSWLDMAKISAEVLIEGLSNESYVGVWTYHQNNPIEVVPPTNLEGNRDDIIGDIHDIERSNMAPLWDTAGEAYTTVKNNIENHPDLNPAVVVLGEGLDTHSSDEAIPLPQIEAGSDTWGPWREMWPDEVGDGLPPYQYLDDVWGKYQIQYPDYTPSDDGWWNEANLNENRRGLLYSDIPIFTIGLGLEHFGDPYNVDNPIQNPDWDIRYDEPQQGDWGDNHPYHVYHSGEFDYPIYGTTEYQLWHIANTSDAEYFFAPDPEDLEDIFDQIAQMLIGAQNLTSVGGPQPLSEPSGELMGDDEPVNIDKWAVTPALDLTNTEEAWLTFWHRYRLIQGVNGAYLQIGYEDPEDGMMWRYIQPSIGPYTGNLLLRDVQLPQDSFGEEVKWCWNGKSAGGTMNWERVKVDLLRDDYQIPTEALDTVRIRLYYKQFGGGVRPGGWWIDDFGVTVTRQGDWGNNIGENMHDQWHLANTTDMDDQDTVAWWNADPDVGHFRGGIDSRLSTVPVDLRNAMTANMTADFKFNINTAAARPPDGFRMEISTNNGRTWNALNLGVRAASGISGDEDSNYWVKAEHLTRLNVDLSDFTGNVVLVRFRMVTCGHPQYTHYEEEPDELGYGGFYINNVKIFGETIHN